MKRKHSSATLPGHLCNSGATKCCTSASAKSSSYSDPVNGPITPAFINDLITVGAVDPLRRSPLVLVIESLLGWRYLTVVGQ